MRYHKVEVVRSELSTIPTAVPAWELPILRVIHSPEAVKVSGFVDYEDSRRPWPDSADSEFQRLRNRYGMNLDGNSAIHYVDIVYGGEGVGQARLAEAIDAERAKVTAEHQKAAAEHGQAAVASDPLTA